MKLNIKSWFNDLSFARMYYFFFMGGWGFILPFLNIFYVSLGFSGKQIGFISSASAVVGMIVSPLWVSAVRKHPNARWILQGALIFGGLGYYLIGRQEIFVIILVVIFFHALIASGIAPMSDSMAVTVSKESGIGYGSVRTFGSLGWIIALLSSGWLIARFGYIAGFVGVFGMWIAAAGVILPMRPHYFTSQQILNQPKNNLRTAIQVVLNDRVLFGFAIALIVIGFLNNGVLQFENVFLSDLGASKQLISVAGIMGAIVELPFMIYADRFARRMGVHRLMLISLSMYFFLRMIVLLLPSIVTIMAVRFIGGVAFSFYTVCFIGLISSRTKTSETGTILALYTVTIAGLVNIVAAPISGAIFDVIGPRWLYALSAAGYVIGVFCLWWVRPDPHEAANEKN